MESPMLYLYYKYLDFFKMRPSSIEDMVDGLIYMDIMQKVGSNG